MRKLILALTALVCLTGPLGAQQVPTYNVGNFPATWSVTQSGSWTFGLSGPIPAGTNAIGSVLADLRVGGAAVASGNPVPVSNNGAFIVQNNAATPAGTNIIGRAGIDQTTDGTTNKVYVTASAPYNYSLSPLAAGGTSISAIFNTNIVAAGNPLPFAYYTCSAFADQAGTLFIEDSVDATTFYPRNSAAGTALTANASVDVRVPIMKNVTRCRFVNGATAQTKFFLGGSPTRY